MLTYLFFPFFLIRLVLVISPTLVKLVLVPTRRYQSLVFGLSTLVLVSLITWSLSPTLLPIKPTEALPFQTEKQVSAKEIEQQLARYLELYEIQPTHRDVVFNISLLYSVLGDTAAASRYRTQAISVDPNHGFFK
jgi:tetratricopeptide (TPR) repeat protein